jgi:FAD/FMN-containing dehydrogenase
VALADGSVVTASADENPDLFWALRGAGANVGIATSFDLRADPVAEVGWVQLAFQVADVAAFLEEFGRVQEAAPRDTTMFLILGRAQTGQPQVAQMYGVVASSDADTIIDRLQPFAAMAPLVGQQVQLAPYASVMANASDAVHAGQGEPHFRSGLARHLDASTAAAAAALVTSGATPWFQIRSVGGAVADVAADATAYAYRDANFSITSVGAGTTFDVLWGQLAEHFEGLYLSFESRQGREIVEHAFPPATLARLQDVKRRYDPQNLFRDNFSVVFD